MSALALETPVFALEIRDADAQSARRARRWLGWVLEMVGVSQDTSDTAALIVSELVTNAAVHAGGRVLTSVQVLGAGLRLAVHDDAPLTESHGPDDDLAESGRGLLIVEALADLSIDTDASGTTVTALLPLGVAA